MMNQQFTQFNEKNYDEVWSDRFNFFQQHGAPDTKTYKQALKLLPHMKRLRINVNFYALFFGFIYFLIKGMWKGALVMFLLAVASNIIAYQFQGFIAFFSGLLVAMIGAFTANYTFYRKEVLGEDDFNIFKGMRL